MKKSLLMLSILLTPVSAFAAPSTYTFADTATFTTPIGVTQNTPLTFATIAHTTNSTTDDTVTLTSANAISSSIVGDQFYGTPTAGVYGITGAASTAVTLAVSGGNLVGGTGGNTTLVTTLALNNTSVTLGTGGTGSVTVAGSFIIPKTTSVSGAYTGSFNLTATY